MPAATQESRLLCRIPATFHTAILFSAVLFILISGTARAQTPPDTPPVPGLGTVTNYLGFSVRYGMAGTGGAGGLDAAAAAKLAGKSESFAVDVLTPPQVPGEKRLLGTGEAHGIQEADLQTVATLLWDYAALKTISPRLQEARVEERSPTRILVYEELGIAVLGIKIGYKFRIESIRDDFPDGAVGLRYRLTESLDGKLYEADSSWYLKEIEVGGKKMLYMRTYSTSGMRNPGFGVAGAVKAFTGGELTGQIQEIAREARNRHK
jgi:hypothetical protein